MHTLEYTNLMSKIFPTEPKQNIPNSTIILRWVRQIRICSNSQFSDFKTGGILDTLTRLSGPGDVLAGSTVVPRRERDDRCLSLRRSFSFTPIDPGSERSPFSSVSDLFDLAVGTICESPGTGMTDTDVRTQLDFTIDFV